MQSAAVSPGRGKSGQCTSAGGVPEVRALLAHSDRVGVLLSPTSDGRDIEALAVEARFGSWCRRYSPYGWAPRLA